jgi:ABC-2 type transport system permease protein
MFSQNTWSVLSYELSRNIQRRGYLFTTFGLPILGLAVFFFLLQSGNADPTTQLQDLDFDLGGITTAGYVDESGFFKEPGELAADVMRPFESVEAAVAALEAAEIDVYYVIPADYLTTGDIELYAPNFSIGVLTSGPLRQMFYSRLQEEGLAMSRLQLLANPANLRTTTLDREGDETVVENTEEENNALVNIFAFLMMFAIFGTNGYLMQTVIEEKENRLVEILLSSVRPVQLLVGKILAMGTLGLLQLGVYVTAIIIAINMAGSENTLGSLSIEPTMFALAVVFFVLGYLLYAAIFGSIGALATTIQEGSGFVSIFAILAILPWLLSTAIVEAPNGGLAVVLSYFPLTAPIGMLMRGLVADISIVEYAISISLLIASVGGMMWVAGRLFRVQSLLAGKMPKIREIPKLVFGG